MTKGATSRERGGGADDHHIVDHSGHCDDLKSSRNPGGAVLGSRLIAYSQNMTVAAMQMADMKV